MKLFKNLPGLTQEFQSNHPKLAEKIAASFGAFAAIYSLMFFINYLQLSMEIQLLVLASMGASTFLLFVVPHSPMAQPWPLIVGHLIAAIMGVICNELIPEPVLATASAVGLAVFIMHLLHALHPPAAATAMIAVIGLPDPDIVWNFVYVIVAVNAGVLLVLALIINNLLPGRQYPVRNKHHRDHEYILKNSDRTSLLNHDDFKWALDQIDAIIDVSETDLMDLYEFALEHSEKRKINRIIKN